MAETELQALVVKLEADISSFKADLLKGQKVVEDAANKMAKSVDDFSKDSQGSFGKFNDAIGMTTKLFAAGGALYAGIEGIKFAMSTIFEAENIRAVNNQFETLAKNAKISGDALKEGLLNAAGGLVDDTDLLKQANKSIIAMGAAAKDLPAVMELARKATAAFGGSAAQNFEQMATAIANGSTKGLKHLGIVVDQEKAYEKFATSIGVSSDQLNEAGKQQALMNAVLERGKVAFKGVNDSVLENQMSWQQLKVTLSQMGEVATLAFEKIGGPLLKNVLGGLKAMAEDAKKHLTANFGEGSEAAAAKVEVLKEKLMEIKGTLIDLDQKQRGFDPTPGMTASQIQTLNVQLKQTQDELKTAEAQLPKTTAAQAEHGKEVTKTTAAYANLKTVQMQMAEQGKKIAEELLKFSPDTVMKAQLEEVTAMKENELITEQEFMDIKKGMLEQKIANDLAMLDAYYAGKKGKEEEYNKAVSAYETTATAQRRAFELQRTQEEKKQQETRKANLKSSLGTISTLMSSSNAEFFAIGKAAAVAQATMDGYAAVQVALKAAPPPFNFALAALVGAASAVNIAKIASSQPPKMAMGGIVPGTSPVGDTVPIMANSGEMFLNNPQQKKLFDMANGRGQAGGSSEGLLAAILDRLNRMELNLSVVVGGRSLVESLNDELRGGRRLVTV